MENYSTPFLEKTKEFVGGFIADNFTEKICYHNIDHTLEVVKATEVIGRKCNLSDTDLETVIIAAWFHDTGYFMGCENHEVLSAQIAEKFLKREKVTPDKIKQVKRCILATKIPQKPTSILEKILCDADLYHLATEKYFEKSELLLRELTLQNQEISFQYWLNLSKDFIETHSYHTKYGKEILSLKQKKTLIEIKKKIKDFEA